METKELTLSFAEITEADVPALTAVMTRAFDDDSRRHLGVERGGPEGYDTGEFFRKWLFPYKESHGYKILLEGQLVGGLIVWILPDGNNILGTIFVDPEFQSRGIGTRTWEFVEATYPDTKSWTLQTPSFATSNHYFYEQKCGFVKISEEPTTEFPGTLWVYRKAMGAATAPTS
jgi:GNAT superfamily N-acetyltransferase